jgi:hypothetical protein
VLRAADSHPIAAGDSWSCCRFGAFRCTPRFAKKTQILVWFQRYFHPIPFIQSETFRHDYPAPVRLCARGVTGRDVKGSSEHQYDAKRENSSDWHLSLLESEDHASPTKLLIARAERQLQSVCVSPMAEAPAAAGHGRLLTSTWRTLARPILDNSDKLTQASGGIERLDAVTGIDCGGAPCRARLRA